MQSHVGGSEEVKVTQNENKSYPLSRVTHEKLKYIEGGFKGWQFIFVNDSPLSKSLDCSKVQEYLNGVQQVPDMFFG